MSRPVTKPQCKVGEDFPQCGCEWTWNYDDLRRMHVSQHGANPEARIVITDEEARNVGQCDHYHIITACDWAARVVAYAHPELTPATGRAGQGQP